MFLTFRFVSGKIKLLEEIRGELWVLICIFGVSGLQKCNIIKCLKRRALFDIEGIIAELDTMLRNESDKEVFERLYEMSSALQDDALIFETLWVLHSSEKKEDKVTLSSFYESVKEAYRGMIKNINESFDYRDVACLSIPGYTQFLTGGPSWGDDPTETYVLWSRLLADDEDDPNPYASWLESKISTMPSFTNSTETKGEYKLSE